MNSNTTGTTSSDTDVTFTDIDLFHRRPKIVINVAHRTKKDPSWEARQQREKQVEGHINHIKLGPINDLIAFGTEAAEEGDYTAAIAYFAEANRLMSDRN